MAREITFTSDIDVYVLEDRDDGNTFPAYYCGGCAKSSGGYANHDYEVVPIYSFTQDTPDGGYSCDSCLAPLP